MAYLDNAASTRALPEVAAAVSRALLDDYANPSSLHRGGLEAERIVTSAREALAAAVGARPDEILFTSGGTEANNLAILGAARARRGRGRHLLVSSIEHDSVLNAAAALEAEGFSVERLPVDGSGRVDPGTVRRMVRPDTILVSVGMVNNEVGTVQPVAEIARALARLGPDRPLFHTDAVQALGKVPLPLQGVDLASFSAHKIHGPKGVGALLARRGVRLLPLVHGGGQERGLRSGTENVPGIAGFLAAVEALPALRVSWPEMRRLRRRLLEHVRAELPGVEVNGPDDEGASGGTEGDASETPAVAPHILNLSLPGLRGEVIVHAMEEEGVLASTGSACTSREPEPSHVLLAMGLPPRRAAAAVRFSLSRFTTEAEVDRAAAAYVAACRRLAAFAERAGRRGRPRSE